MQVATPRSRFDRLYVLLAFLLAIGVMGTFESGIFFGSRLIGWDATTEYYSWYVNGLLSFYHGPFTVLNPYMDGGTTNYNLLANYDPIYLIPLLTGRIPDLFQEQWLVLVHLLFVPACVIALAKLYRVSGARLLLVGALGAVAAFSGHILNLLSESMDLNCYGWAFVAITAIEYYRVKKGSAYLIAAAVALSFSLMIPDGGAAYWPLFIIPYFIVCWHDFRNPAFKRDAILAIVVVAALSAPGIVQRAHQWHTIQIATAGPIAKQFSTGRDALDFLGVRFTPVNTVSDLGLNRSLFALPGILSLMLLAGFSRMSVRERWLFGSVLGVLFIHALGAVTPLEHIVRTLYPPAALFQRSYDDLNIAVPILFMVIIRFFIAQKTLAIQWRTYLVVGLVLLFVISALIDPALSLTNLVLVGMSVAFLYLCRWPVAVGLLILSQWALLVFVPVSESSMAPHDRAVVENEINVGTYQNLGKILSDPDPSSRALYRVIGIGVIKTFGNYAGVRRFYNLVSDISQSRTPHELYEVTQFNEGGIEQSLRAHPELIASQALRDMAVRYYIVNAADADIVTAAQKGHPELRRVPNAGPLLVLRDPLAHPFVSALGKNGAVLGGVQADVDWDTITFDFPRQASFVNLAYLYDPWWHITAAGTCNCPINSGGQLQISGKSLRGKRTTVRYYSQLFNVALVFEILCYISLATGTVVALKPLVARLLHVKEKF